MNTFFRKQYNIMETTSIITDKELCWPRCSVYSSALSGFLENKRDNSDIHLSFNFKLNEEFVSFSIQFHKHWQFHLH